MYNETKVVTVEGMDMIIFENEFISDHIVRDGKFWEYHIMDKFINNFDFPKDGLMLDIGANIGNHCLMFRKNFPDLKIWAFEMSYINFSLLYKNLLPHKDFKCFNVAVSDETKIISYKDSEDNNYGGISVHSLDSGTHFNISVPLDALTFPEPVSFIKIDIEEHEIYAFQGMKNLLLRDKPLIWTEDWIKFGKITGHFENPNSENKPSSVEYLMDLGYEIIDEYRADFLMKFKD